MDIDIAKTSCQEPVWSITHPTMGAETVAAIASPVFMMPLEVAACRGAKSIATAHNGAVTSSDRKNAARSSSLFSRAFSRLQAIIFG